jgi:ribose 5-phosphate isomerase B
MNKMVSVAVASDHAGFAIKQQIIEYLKNSGYHYRDFGTDSDDPSDYPDFAHPVANAVEKGEFTYGIVACGSGNGVNMVVNKHQGIRSGLCWNKEIAGIVRRHNNANICALPGRFISKEEALEIVEEFLTTEFEGGRHKRRVGKIALKNKKSEGFC